MRRKENNEKSKCECRAQKWACLLKGSTEKTREKIQRVAGIQSAICKTILEVAFANGVVKLDFLTDQSANTDLDHKDFSHSWKLQTRHGCFDIRKPVQLHGFSKKFRIDC